jgi:hypothetical protein
VAKILIKTAILLFIIFSIYFIVNPSACSNFLAGRVTNSDESEPTQTVPYGQHGEMFAPTGDGPLPTDGQPATTPAKPTEVKGIVDTNTLTEQQAAQQPTAQYSQDDIDYAIASRYVELENEYARKKKVGKDTAKEISYIVMDDFELTQQEWEAFLTRATASNLFNKVRTEMASLGK